MTVSMQLAQTYRPVRYEVLAGTVTIRLYSNAGAERPLVKAFANRRRDSTTKREAVVETAGQLFIDGRHGRTSMNDVAERLQISKPAPFLSIPRWRDIIAFPAQANEFPPANHQKALAAQVSGKFPDEIARMTVPLAQPNGGARLQKTEFQFQADEGPHVDASLQALAKLKPAFHAKGIVTPAIRLRRPTAPRLRW